MTIFAEDLFSFLSTAGTAAGSRIYPNNMPQEGTMPAVKYFLVNDPPEYTQSGRSNLNHPRYQFECYADGNDGYLDAVKLAQEVIAEIELYKGMMGQATVHVGFREENMRDNYDPELNRHWVLFDMTIWHSK